MSLTPRRWIAGTALLFLLGAVLALVVVPASGAPVGQLPDLVSEPVGDPDTVAGTDTVDGETRLLLRFEGYIANKGPGPLEVTGKNPQERRISGPDLHQVIKDGGAQALPGAELLYETTDLHDHWHFQKAARYSLWDGTKTHETGDSTKVGFCFLDIERFGGPSDDFEFGGNCLRREPEFTGTLRMGISRGWHDVYEKTLPFQYVDVSNTTPGHYWLHAEVDPQNLIREADEHDPGTFAEKRSTVPGHVAKPASGVRVSGEASKITLAAESFGEKLGPVRYRIVEPPRRGQLTTPGTDAGGWFAGSQVSYSTNGAHDGCDSFRFAAKQEGSQFPLAPAGAAVTLHVGRGDCSGGVTINGAPDFLFTGEGAQLSTAAPGAVTWKVNDVAGGNSTVGTITAGGHYTAPAAVPTGGKVKISAVAGNGSFDEVEIEIKARRTSGATPDVESPPMPSAKRRPLSKPVIGRNGRLLVVKLTPGRTGRLKVNVNRTKSGIRRRVAACSVRVVRARPATCRFRLRKDKVRKLNGRITVYATLTVKGRRVAARRSTVSLVKKPSASYVGMICILTP